MTNQAVSTSVHDKKLTSSLLPQEKSKKNIYRLGKKSEVVVVLFKNLAKALVCQHGVERVIVGGGGNTPKILGDVIEEIYQPVDRFAYSDACTIQRVIFDKNMLELEERFKLYNQL